MTMVAGRFVGATQDEILSILMANAKVEWGDDLNDDELAVIRTFYRPVAALLADVQTDISTVLDSAQLDYAEGQALDLLTALIGVKRKPAYRATGEVTFSRSTPAGVDYLIPTGTVVQTDSLNPIRFETTEAATITAGTSEVTGVSIRAVEAGTDSNIGANTLRTMTDAPPGVEEVTNLSATDGGENQERDDDLRERAKSELSDGMLGTALGIRNQVLKTEGVKTVSLFVNDTDQVDGSGLKPQHTECVVDGGVDQEVGQTIFESKAAGDGTQGGIHGTEVSVLANIGNGQTHPVAFSRPTTVLLYIDMDVKTNSQYEGDSAVRDAIVRYVGGTIASGDEEDGRLGAGDDVIYTKILAAIMSINGVEDVPSLTIGKTASPTGTSNVAIAVQERAVVDATDGSISITEV